MFIAIDDTYGPEQDTGSVYVTGARRTHVAVVFRDGEVAEIRQQLGNCRNFVTEMLGRQVSEFHFTDIYNRSGPWASAQKSENLDIIAAFASIYREYRWPVFVQTVDDRTMADHVALSDHPLMMVGAKID